MVHNKLNWEGLEYQLKNPNTFYDRADEAVKLSKNRFYNYARDYVETNLIAREMGVSEKVVDYLLGETHN